MNALTQKAFGLDKKLNLQKSLPNKYDLSIGEPKLSPFPIDIFNEIKLIKNINCYYPSHGDLSLREIIIQKYYPLNNVNNIAITHGAIGAIDFIFRANLNSEAEILIPDPGFPPYCKLAEFTGAKIKKYSIHLNSNDEYSLDWESIEKNISSSTKFILLNSPHNPTGKTLTKNDFARFQKLMNKYLQLSFIMDEVYRELIFGNKSHLDFSHFIDRGYIVGSFSKMYPLQGARIGWVLTSDDRMKKLTPFFNNATGSMSSFGQEIVKNILKKELNFQNNYLIASKEACRILDHKNVDYIVPEGAFFVFIKYNYESTQVTEELEELGVDVVPGIAFGLTGKNYIRASFAQEEDVLINGFNIIADHWNKVHARILQ